MGKNLYEVPALLLEYARPQPILPHKE